mgnify:CR=1 FL=1
MTPIRYVRAITRQCQQCHERIVTHHVLDVDKYVVAEVCAFCLDDVVARYTRNGFVVVDETPGEDPPWNTDSTTDTTT